MCSVTPIFLLALLSCSTSFSNAFLVPHKKCPRHNSRWHMSATTSATDPRTAHVAQFIHQLFPPERLSERHAVSRQDGYWPYISTGTEPPAELVYGEFDLFFFARLLNRGLVLAVASKDQVFVDLGSGIGRLVWAAAALHPHLKQARGIEILASLHQQAMDKTSSLEQTHRMPMAPMDFVCGSFTDPNVYMGDASVIFVFSTAMPESVRNSLTLAVQKQCRPGTIVISTDYALPESVFEVLEAIDGYEETTGGISTGYIHRLL